MIALQTNLEGADNHRSIQKKVKEECVETPICLPGDGWSTKSSYLDLLNLVKSWWSSMLWIAMRRNLEM